MADRRPIKQLELDTAEQWVRTRPTRKQVAKTKKKKAKGKPKAKTKATPNAKKAKPPAPPKKKVAPPKSVATKPAPDSLWLTVKAAGKSPRKHLSERVTLVHGDAAEWVASLPDNSVHAIVTDPPYGLIEYNETNHTKMLNGKGGVWRIPPTLDGVTRSPLPRFTVLSDAERSALTNFFVEMAKAFKRILVPGGHVFIASNPLLSSQTFVAFEKAGLEKRGEIIRLTQTLRGGDRPKNAEKEFPDVSMMPRSCWEPWGIFRKSMEGTAAVNLRKWGTGGLRRISDAEPFKDVIECPPARGKEKKAAPHPSLKPQCFLRQIVLAALPLGRGIVYDPFAGSGSTLAAAEAVGYTAIGTERDASYFEMGCGAFPALAALSV